LGQLFEEARRLALDGNREDLVERLAQAAKRTRRADIVLCVVGEFKQGKSALVNALLADDVCPVDDDLATVAVTIVRWGKVPRLKLRRRGSSTISDEIPASLDLARYVLEDDSGIEKRDVEMAEVELPNPLLERGITIVDTPGVGGLNAAHAAATLAFLPSADALLFVSDASAELTAAEFEFLRRARAACPVVVLVVSKSDLYPAWRSILDLDRQHLADADQLIETIAISSMLADEGRRRGDRSLELESGLPALVELLERRVLVEASAAAAGAAVRELQMAVEQLRAPIAAEVTALTDPQRGSEARRELAELKARLMTLAASEARWSRRLDDGFDALLTSVEQAFATRIRNLVRAAQDELEPIDPAAEWSAYSARLQQAVADTVQRAFVDLADGAREVQSRIAELILDDELPLDAPTADVSVDLAAMWPVQSAAGGPPPREAGWLGAIERATVGTEMLALLGSLLGTALVGPALLGAALLFGGRHIRSERKRRLAEQRQEARSIVTEFVNDVRVEVDGRISALGRELQRQTREYFNDRLDELARTHAELSAALDLAARQDDMTKAERVTSLEQRLGALEDLRRRADALTAR
jgi:GTPase SAR1 family protein